MTKSNPKIKITRPKSFLNKPLRVDFKALFIGISKGIGHYAVGKWDEIAADTVEALSSIGLETEPGELAFLLIRRAAAKAIFDLVGENAAQFLADAKINPQPSLEQLDFSILQNETFIDERFLDRPAGIPLLGDIQLLLEKLFTSYGICESTSKSIIDRYPSYFIYSLNQEWRRNSKSYRPLIDALDTPFAKAGEREWAWRAYDAHLERKTQESIFDESFGLKQIFVPLNAYYQEDNGKELKEGIGREVRQRRRVVVPLQSELEQWLRIQTSQDAIRVLSGGPGSGKSSFARIFAAQISQIGKIRVLFIPLHLIDPGKELVDEVGRFVRDEGILIENPLNPESPEPNLLIIFDGLDELASQGKAAAETARAFIREVERTLERRNQQTVKLRVLISGRELVVQENECEFRRPAQILNLLPYFLPQTPEGRSSTDGEQYYDPKKLLKTDLRHQWWTKYGNLTGKDYGGLPGDLSRDDLAEVTAQPLLNYLIALSYNRDKLDFTKGINLNSIYADLVAAVHERGYEKHRSFGPIRHMTQAEFSLVLEEIGLAAWHGDGRTTTVREIEEHCRMGGVGALLSTFQEGAKLGVTRLLAAFFFRQYGQRPSGDPTFVFTHKSFGEYLTARRVVRAIERMIREIERRADNPGEGWDERDALKHWVQICGPSPISRYLHVFLLNEIRLRDRDLLVQWQLILSSIFGYMLRHGAPMEQIQSLTFKEAGFQARNAEEALLVALNACARETKEVSSYNCPDTQTFGAWFKRIQGQRDGAESVLAADCLSYLDLSDSYLHMGDFYGANFNSSKLRRVLANFANFYHANLRDADLESAFLGHSSFERAFLEGANLKDARCEHAIFKNAFLKNANFEKAHLISAEFDDASGREFAIFDPAPKRRRKSKA